MTINWNQDQPIIHHLRDVLPIVFPVLKEPGHGLHATGIGGYVNRTQRNSTSTSSHSEGRGADIFLNVNNPYEKAIGDGLSRMFQDYSWELGVDNVIWNYEIWSIARGGPRYCRKPHTNHVHVEFTEAGSQIRPYMLRDFAVNVLNALPIEALQFRRAKSALGSITITLPWVVEPVSEIKSVALNVLQSKLDISARVEIGPPGAKRKVRQSRTLAIPAEHTGFLQNGATLVLKRNNKEFVDINDFQLKVTK